MSVASPTSAAGGDSQIAYFDVNLTPSLEPASSVPVSVAESVPSEATGLGVPVGSQGAVPAELGLDRAALAAAGFTGKTGQSLSLPRVSGPTLVLVGIGDPAQVDTAVLRDAAAAFT